MRNKMEKLVNKLNTSVMYFTENPVNFDSKWDGCKYFLVWQNTHHIFKGFKTQTECVDFLEELIANETVWIDGFGFNVIE